MRKLSVSILLIIAMVAAMAFAGCSKNNSADSSSSSNGDGDKAVKVGFSCADRTDTFMSGIDAAIRKYAEEQGVELVAQDAQKDVQRQIDQIQTMVSMGCKAIVVLPVDTAPAESMNAAAGDVPLIYINRLPDEDQLEANKYVGVGSDENESGGFQGEFISELFADKDPKTLDVALLQGTMGHPATILRSESAIAKLKDAGFDVNMVFEDTAEFDRAKAMQVFQTFLGTGKHVDVVIANNDEMALGAIEAMKAVGKTTDELPVVGIDATNDAKLSLKEGGLSATVFQDGVGQAQGGLDVALKLIDGESVDIITFIPFQLVTLENVDTIGK
ncbi:MAG: substrate-binding domain-containing protein [Clostridiales Family XIII bacterium]|jgi:ABC-type sugar transport system substrate-binding protein|nr:substrate-binding domain-containing protein [Clostridiales Family XIII bacterium]